MAQRRYWVAMSKENVEVRNEVVRRFFSAFDNDTDAFRTALHPEIEWFPIEENRTPTYGVEAAMRNRNQWLDTLWSSANSPYGPPPLSR